MARLLSDTLILTAEKNPQKTAIICNEGAFSYEQLLSDSRKLAGLLQAKGVRRGDRVIIFMNNGWACAVGIYGILFCGAVFVVVNPQTKADKLAYLLGDTGAAALLTEAALARNFLPAISDQPALKAVICRGTIKAKAPPMLVPFDDINQKQGQTIAAPNPALSVDLAAISYTSGSTGDPKGVMQPHHSMLFSAGSIIEYLGLTESDRILCVLPLAFNYGLYQLLMSVILGATLILEHSFLYTGQVFEHMLKHEVTLFSGVPTIFSMLEAAHNRKPICFPTVTRVTNAAAALPQRYLGVIKTIFPNAAIYKMYGLTECTRVCYLDPGLVDEKPGSVGRAIPGTEMFLLSETGQQVAPGQTGILHVRGQHVMPGYWQKPDLTNKMLIPGRHPGENTLCTQDLFYQDQEGDYYFVGRSDDIIKSRGEKVSPAEVEKVLYDISAIKEAAVVGAADAMFGEAVCAFVVANEGSQVDERRIKRICATRLEDFMVPKHFLVWEALPKNANGKIDKKNIKQWAAENLASG